MNTNKENIIFQPNVSPHSEEILNKTPKELAEYIQNLEADGILEDFLDQAVKDDQLVAHLSYWEKWFPPSARKIIDNKVKLERQAMMESENILPLDLESRYTAEELEYLFASLEAMQLTFGCSKGCRNCGFDALPKVRDAF